MVESARKRRISVRQKAMDLNMRPVPISDRDGLSGLQ